MDFKKEIDVKVELIDRQLEKYLRIDYPKSIYEAMRYSVFSDGKKLRPIILLASCEAFGGNLDDALPYACALEMIHTYSLIHDDLPAMDDDDLRRGRPTNHKVFGEAFAILAGDGLLNLAFEVMAESCLLKNERKYNEAMFEIASASGVRGMVGGQCADMMFENKKAGIDELIYIHENKTAKLIAAAFVSGAVLGGANACEKEKMREAGRKLGHAFQMKDDLLDVLGDEKILGKPIGSDLKSQKSTYVSLLSLDGAEKLYLKTSGEAIEALSKVEGNTEFLADLFLSLISRIK